ncbi:hypothetical protein EAI_17172, partial [Harpegnathos saltator]
KDIIYRNRPTTKNDMVIRIIEAIQSLSSDEILRATNSFQNRVDICIKKNGARFEHYFT